MKLIKIALASAPLLAALFTYTDTASACGGCFHEPPLPMGEPSQVTGHRMIQVISNTESTLYDQISYSGNPASFAWVLPVKGLVNVGLSSDIVFAALSDATRINVLPPPLNCPQPPFCQFDSVGVGTAGAGGGTLDGGVTVVAEQVVGPFATVQLSSMDPAALTNWLVTNGYQIPPDIVPVITAYVNEGFDFFAMKLVPGAGLDSMRPVRIATPGANPVLPLRMVAAGTGVTTPITLWILGEGRYEAKSAPMFAINPADVVWDWDTSMSNYTLLRDTGFKTNVDAWLVEDAEPMSKNNFVNTIQTVCDIYPTQSGYGDANGMMVQEECQADLAQLFSGINSNSLWVTRIRGELSRKAFGKDLTIGASATQTQVAKTIQTLKTTGTKPECPVYSPCDNTTGGGGTGGSGSGEGSGCGIVGDQQGTQATMMLTLAALFGAVRRRKTK